MSFWKDKKVLVTGGAGHIGSTLVKALLAEGAKVRAVDNLERGKLEYLAPVMKRIGFTKADLSDFNACLQATQGMDVVLHLAARLGGVEYMYAQAAATYTPNILMNTHMLEAARLNKVDKYLFTSTACIYRVEDQVDPNCPPLKEDMDIPAHPESSYGWTKLMGEIQCRAYEQDYHMNISVIRMFNVYGENEDLDPQRSHVIPALIRKAIEYPKVKPYVVFGNGYQTRSFLYVSDACRGIMMAAAADVGTSPINIGLTERVTIRNLVEKVVFTSGKEIDPFYDTSKPTGAVGRAADSTKAKKVLGWEPLVSLDEGIKRTYNWAKDVLDQA